jgi:hypothetical protein
MGYQKLRLMDIKFTPEQFDELLSHLTHNVQLVDFNDGGHTMSVALECRKCAERVLEIDNPDFQ